MESKFNFFKSKEVVFDGEKNKDFYINKLISDLKKNGLVNLSDWEQKTSQERYNIINILSSGRKNNQDQKNLKSNELQKESYDEQFFCLLANLDIKENFYEEHSKPENELMLKNIEKRDLFKLPLGVIEMQKYVTRNDNYQDIEIIDKLKTSGFKESSDFFSKNIKDKEYIIKNIMGYEKIWQPVWGDNRSLDDVLNEMYLVKIYHIASLLDPAWSYVDILKKHSLYKENMKLEEIKGAFEFSEDLNEKYVEEILALAQKETDLYVANVIKKSYEESKDDSMTFEEYEKKFHLLLDKKNTTNITKEEYNINIKGI